MWGNTVGKWLYEPSCFLLLTIWSWLQNYNSYNRTHTEEVNWNKLVMFPRVVWPKYCCSAFLQFTWGTFRVVSLLVNFWDLQNTETSLLEKMEASEAGLYCIITLLISLPTKLCLPLALPENSPTQNRQPLEHKFWSKSMTMGYPASRKNQWVFVYGKLDHHNMVSADIELWFLLLFNS